MAIFGLLDAEKFSANRFKNFRRSVFYYYPQGSAPLLGLLSLMEDEETNDPEFHWFEKIKSDQRTATAVNQTGAFITDTSGNADASSPFNITAGLTIRVIVADASMLRVGHIVRIAAAPKSSGTANLIGRISAVYGGTGNGGLTGNGGTHQGIDIKLQEATSAVLNIGSSLGLEVLVVGMAASEGQVGAALTPYELPVEPSNYTQISRTPFNLTGTAAKTSATFDSSGPYKDKSKDALNNHMTELERNILFGRKGKDVAADGNPIRFTGGILWFLEQWEATSNNLYKRLGATADTDDDKRVITNSGGTINEKTLDKYLERVFRFTSNKANEKLMLCGSGLLLVLNQLYKSKTTLNANQGSENETYGMSMVTLLSPFGTIRIRTHPLFSENPTLRYCALITDVNNLNYRYLTGRDTELLKNRQANDADFRTDEFLTEAGLELRQPASHMFLQNVLDYA